MMSLGNHTESLQIKRPAGTLGCSCKKQIIKKQAISHLRMLQKKPNVLKNENQHDSILSCRVTQNELPTPGNLFIRQDALRGGSK